MVQPEKSFEVKVDAGETVEIAILGGLAGDRGVIAADIKRSTEEN